MGKKTNKVVEADELKEGGRSRDSSSQRGTEPVQHWPEWERGGK